MLVCGLSSRANGASADTYLPWEDSPAYYRKWAKGISGDPGYFPIAVWLQDPKTAKEYKAIGVNMFVGALGGALLKSNSRLSPKRGCRSW